MKSGSSSSSSHNRKPDISHDTRVAIHTLHNAGYSVKEIHKKLGSPAYRTIARIVKTYKETGNIDVLPHSGQPHVINCKQDPQIALLYNI